MKKQLYKSFESYIKYVQSSLKKILPVHAKQRDDGKLHIAYIDSSYRLRSIVERIEASDEFYNLVSDFSIAFEGRPIKKSKDSSFISIQEHKIKNFSDAQKSI